MNAGAIAIDVLLAAAVLLELLCCAGVLLMRNAFDRLHYLGPAVVFGPLAVAIAIMIAAGPISQQGIKSFIILIVMTVTGPVLSFVTARIIRFREAGELAMRQSDTVQRG